MLYEKDFVSMERFYLITGSETYEKGEMLEKIKQNFGTIEEGINYIVLDKESVSNIEIEASTVPFGYSKKLIVVKYDHEKTGKDTEKDSKAETISETMIEMFASFNNSVCVVFIGDFSIKSKIYQFVEKNGKCFVFDKKKESELISWGKEQFAQNDISISNGDIAYLLDICGTEKQILMNEIDKLSAYAMQSKKISKEAIDLLCIKSSEMIIFDLTDSLGSKDIKKSLQILQELIDNKEPLPKILVMVAKHYKSLLVTKITLKRGGNVLSELDTKSTYAANKYKTQARLLEESQLVTMIQKLAKLDVDAKVGKIDLKIGLEKLICEM